MSWVNKIKTQKVIQKNQKSHSYGLVGSRTSIRLPRGKAYPKKLISMDFNKLRLLYGLSLLTKPVRFSLYFCLTCNEIPMSSKALRHSVARLTGMVPVSTKPSTVPRCAVGTSTEHTSSEPSGRSLHKDRSGSDRLDNEANSSRLEYLGEEKLPLFLLHRSE